MSIVDLDFRRAFPENLHNSPHPTQNVAMTANSYIAQRDERNRRFSKMRPSEPGDDWSSPLLGDWVRWMRAARLSKQTIKARGPVVEMFAREVSVDPRVATADDVLRWYSDNPHWAPATAAAYHAALKAWFAWLTTQGHREDNPMLKLGTPPQPKRQPRPVSTEDLKRMLRTRMQHRTRVMILLAALAGLRVSEIAKIRGEDIDLPGRLLYVTGKGRVPKAVPLHPMLAYEATRMPSSGYWFPRRAEELDYSAPMRGSSVSQTIQSVMTRAGVRSTPHALRHWFGTAALRECGDLRTVQELMRHASITSTELYTAVADEKRADVVDRLDPFA